MIDNQILGLPAGENVDINHQSNVLGKVTAQVHAAEQADGAVLLQRSEPVLPPRQRLRVHDAGRFMAPDRARTPDSGAVDLGVVESLVHGRALRLPAPNLPARAAVERLGRVEDRRHSVDGVRVGAKLPIQPGDATANASLSYFHDHLAGGTHAFKFGLRWDARSTPTTTPQMAMSTPTSSTASRPTSRPTTPRCTRRATSRTSRCMHRTPTPSGT